MPLDVLEGKSAQVAESLRSQCNVVNIDAASSRNEVIMVIEASTHRRLARLTMRALASVEAMIQDQCLHSRTKSA